VPYVNPEATACTAVQSNGTFCDRQSLPDAPFPICVHHAALILQFIKDRLPRTEPEIQATRRRAEEQERIRTAPISRARAERSTVYYLQVGPHIKIGRTTNLTERMRDYPPGSTLLATETGGLAVERQRLRQFERDLRAGNEWFFPSDALLAHVASLQRRAA
jgi:hypothetical protein